MPNWNFSELESVSHESDVTIGEDQLPGTTYTHVNEDVHVV